jgi:hypothetical protein
MAANRSSAHLEFVRNIGNGDFLISGGGVTVGLACAKSNFPPKFPKTAPIGLSRVDLDLDIYIWAGALKNEFLAPPPFPVGALSTAPAGLATRNCFSGLGYNRENLRRREVTLPRARPFLRARLFL